jgi:hypothetical protein
MRHSASLSPKEPINIASRAFTQIAWDKASCEVHAFRFAVQIILHYTSYTSSSRAGRFRVIEVYRREHSACVRFVKRNFRVLLVLEYRKKCIRDTARRTPCTSHRKRAIERRQARWYSTLRLLQPSNHDYSPVLEARQSVAS